MMGIAMEAVAVFEVNSENTVMNDTTLITIASPPPNSNRMPHGTCLAALQSNRKPPFALFAGMMNSNIAIAIDTVPSSAKAPTVDTPNFSSTTSSQVTPPGDIDVGAQQAFAACHPQQGHSQEHPGHFFLFIAHRPQRPDLTLDIVFAAASASGKANIIHDAKVIGGASGNN